MCDHQDGVAWAAVYQAERRGRATLAQLPVGRASGSRTTWKVSATAGLLVRDFHLGVAAGSGCVHCRDNSINVAVYGRPLRIAKHHYGDPAAFEVLWYRIFLSVDGRRSKWP